MFAGCFYQHPSCPPAAEIVKPTFKIWLPHFYPINIKSLALYIYDQLTGYQDSWAKNHLQTRNARKAEYQRTKRETVSHYAQKHLQMSQRPQCKSWKCSTLRGKRKQKSLWAWVRSWFLRYDTKCISNGRRNRWNRPQNLKVLTTNDSITKPT